MELLKYDKPSDSYSYFTSFVESLLNKNKNNKPYDMLFYDNKFTDIYNPYLLNLKHELLEKYIEKFDSKIVNEIYTPEGELVGLVIFIIK